MERNDLMLFIIQLCLVDGRTGSKVLRDYTETFYRLGIDKRNAAAMARKVLRCMQVATSMTEAEESINKLFLANVFNGKTVFDMIQDGLIERCEIIFKQISPYLKNVKGKILDYGCGNGVLAQMIHDRLGHDIEGVDVCDFKSDTVTIPVRVFDGYSVPVADGYYEAVIIITTAHHEANNEKILEEASRVAQGLIVMIETVPDSNFQWALKRDWGRIFLNDILWNRFFNPGANIPVPGKYDTPKNWAKRLSRYFPIAVMKKNLGRDQPTIQDTHWLGVYRK